MAPNAPDFQKLITDARERKKNSALADRIFSRDRRQSAPSKLKPTPGGSLASRVGVKKQRAPAAAAAAAVNTRRASLPAGNVNGEWTHDLHDSVNGKSAKGGSLSSRITLPGAKTNNATTTKRAANRKAKLAAAVDKMDTDQVNVVTPTTQTRSGMGLTIRGLAGPFALLGQNFAPGTTAADIESAMTPIGGEMVSCKIVKTKPFLIAEMVFVSREGGERVIDTFNNKTADGRVLKIYPKVGGYQASASDRSNEPPANAPSGPKSSKASTRDQVVDGSMGFPDLMDADGKTNSSGNNRLYSDKMVGGNKRGRGFQRGKGR
ncbi:pentatricopeptide repeat protein [Pochonia chlamydosporia 170]|uniref:Pentatricopeptide repeat protein n=1 Tax=Pochonia chlamydosporia 170 TaxID=1380566 RepID=A0A179FST7_METCM|nr:pentatricopeptide repeat protein [Pochonia chlamydosporia 170]OAQ68201.1 pentatricopeptide repeat protein [Pochonia chlamydosporia 170]